MSELDIPLSEEWEDETGLQERAEAEKQEKSRKETHAKEKEEYHRKKFYEELQENMSDLAISYVLQIKEIRQELQQEYLKIQKLEMSIRGFTAALHEELSKEEKE